MLHLDSRLSGLLSDPLGVVSMSNPHDHRKVPKIIVRGCGARSLSEMGRAEEVSRTFKNSLPISKFTCTTFSILVSLFNVIYQYLSQGFIWKLRLAHQLKVLPRSQGLPKASQDLKGSGPGAAEAMGASLRSCQALCPTRKTPTQNRNWHC